MPILENEAKAIELYIKESIDIIVRELSRYCYRWKITEYLNLAKDKSINDSDFFEKISELFSEPFSDGNLECLEAFAGLRSLCFNAICEAEDEKFSKFLEVALYIVPEITQLSDNLTRPAYIRTRQELYFLNLNMEDEHPILVTTSSDSLRNFDQMVGIDEIEAFSSVKYFTIDEVRMITRIIGHRPEMRMPLFRDWYISAEIRYEELYNNDQKKRFSSDERVLHDFALQYFHKKIHIRKTIDALLITSFVLSPGIPLISVIIALTAPVAVPVVAASAAAAGTVKTFALAAVAAKTLTVAAVTTKTTAIGTTGVFAAKTGVMLGATATATFFVKSEKQKKQEQRTHLMMRHFQKSRSDKFSRQPSTASTLNTHGLLSNAASNKSEMKAITMSHE